jgi:hypothetical protein
VLFRVLDDRELGVEFAIDRLGNIWQFADPATVDTFDAGYVNARSVGVEIVNYGFRRRGAEVPRRGRDRETYTTTLNGKRRKLARFYPPQLISTLAWLDAIHVGIPSIPRCIPLDDNGDPLAETMTRREVRNFSGVLGHYHVSARKSDPGTHVFDVLAGLGYAEPARQAC